MIRHISAEWEPVRRARMRDRDCKVTGSGNEECGAEASPRRGSAVTRSASGHPRASRSTSRPNFDRKRLWVELGHASLFYFLHRELGLSSGAAFYRKTAAGLIQRFPEIIDPLRDGRLCLTSVVELAKVLTPENRDDVLPRFFHLSKSGAKAVSAALRPAEAAPHRAVVTAVRPTAAAPAPGLAAPAARDPILESPFHPDETPRANPVQEPTPTVPASPPRTVAEPLTADLRRLHVTVSRRLMEKLAAARAALSHSHPGATEGEILEAGLDLLLERHAKRKGLVEKPLREPPRAKPDHVPAHVKRAVWKRNGGRCQWVVDGGGICGSTHQVELDHVVPRGRGGPPTIENTRCLCRFHNQLAAREVYGDAWMDKFTVRRAKRRVLSGMKGARLE